MQAHGNGAACNVNFCLAASTQMCKTGIGILWVSLEMWIAPPCAKGPLVGSLPTGFSKGAICMTGFQIRTRRDERAFMQLMHCDQYGKYGGLVSTSAVASCHLEGLNIKDPMGQGLRAHQHKEGAAHTATPRGHHDRRLSEASCHAHQCTLGHGLRGHHVRSAQVGYLCPCEGTDTY